MVAGTEVSTTGTDTGSVMSIGVVSNAENIGVL